MMTGIILQVRPVHYDIAGIFRISRGSKTVAEVVMVELLYEDKVGRGEGVPYRRYGETIQDAVETIEQLRNPIEDDGFFDSKCRERDTAHNESNKFALADRTKSFRAWYDTIFENEMIL